MSLSGKGIWISPRSWVVDDQGEIRRLRAVSRITGIGREGSAESKPVQVAELAIGQRHMFEVFTSGGYAIIDQDSNVVSLVGPISVGEAITKLTIDDPIHVEDYVGNVSSDTWSIQDVEVPPHCAYLTRNVVVEALRGVLNQNTLPISIPRPLFAQTWWLMGFFTRKCNAPLVVSVDNVTFPCRLEMNARQDSGCRLLAITEFTEPQAHRLPIEDTPWHLVCDGLVVA